jgi:hypothetical protein
LSLRPETYQPTSLTTGFLFATTANDKTVL